MADTMVPTKKTTAPAPAMEPFHVFRTEMDRLFDRFLSGFSWPMMRRPLWREPTWDFETTFKLAAPKVDVTEDTAAYKLAAELPGLTEKDIELSVAEGMLTLKGEKDQEKEEKNQQYWLSERTYGSFQRSFALPESVDPEKVDAKFANGVLTITLPKKPEVVKAAKKIEVKPA
jgi:HSP20 family protein